MATRSGGMPVGNLGVVYSGFGDDAAFNAGVQRIDPVLRHRRMSATRWQSPAH